MPLGTPQPCETTERSHSTATSANPSYRFWPKNKKAITADDASHRPHPRPHGPRTEGGWAVACPVVAFRASQCVQRAVESCLRYFKSEIPYTANDVVQIELPVSCICVTSIPVGGRFRRPSCVT